LLRRPLVFDAPGMDRRFQRSFTPRSLASPPKPLFACAIVVERARIVKQCALISF
jgi:hypothetical protein